METLSRLQEFFDFRYVPAAKFQSIGDAFEHHEKLRVTTLFDAADVRDVHQGVAVERMKRRIRHCDFGARVLGSGRPIR